MLEKFEMVRVGICGVSDDIVRPVNSKHQKLPLFVDMGCALWTMACWACVGMVLENMLFTCEPVLLGVRTEGGRACSHRAGEFTGQGGLYIPCPLGSGLRQ